MGRFPFQEQQNKTHKTICVHICINKYLWIQIQLRNYGQLILSPESTTKYSTSAEGTAGSRWIHSMYAHIYGYILHFFKIGFDCSIFWRLLSPYLPVYLPIRLFVCLSVYLSIYLSFICVQTPAINRGNGHQFVPL